MFFVNDTATTEIYTLSLHDALPIYVLGKHERPPLIPATGEIPLGAKIRARRWYLGRTLDDVSQALGYDRSHLDRKSTRLNSSHANISYAVFCLKKKNKSFNSSCPIS